MQAIITKYIPPSNVRPARIKATCERGSITLSYHNQEGNDDEKHRSVCDALCARFDAEDAEKYGSRPGAWSWSRPKASGQIPSGEHVFCFIPERVYRRASK